MHLYHAFSIPMPKRFNELSNVKTRPDLVPQTTTTTETPKPSGLLNNKHLAFDANGKVVNPRELKVDHDRKRITGIAAVGLMFVVFGQVYLGSAINSMSRSIDRLANTSLTGDK